jgi:hypothetical protein
MQGGQPQLGPDGQPIKQSLLQKIMGWGSGAMEMLQMPMMMFSQVMMMVQQQAMSLMMSVMMLPQMMMMMPMVKQQVNQLLGRDTTDPNTGLAIPKVQYTKPPLATRVGRKVERRLRNICDHFATGPQPTSRHPLRVRAGRCAS